MTHRRPGFTLGRSASFDKHFLFDQNGAVVGPGGSYTWTTLQTVNSVTPPTLTLNQTWPLTSPGFGGPGVMRSRLGGTGAVGSGRSSGDIVRTVNNTAASLGCADIGDVISVGTAQTLQVESGVIRGVVVQYAAPLVSNNANCSGVTYGPTPAGASTGRNVDWSNTYAIGGSTATYPYAA